MPGQRVVAFVTGVFVDVISGAAQGDFALPWLRVRGRVLNRELIQDLVRADARKAFGHLTRRRQVEALLDSVVRPLPRIEVGGFDDERVAFPTADRVAHPGRDVVGQVLALEADHSRVVDHLDEDHDVIGRLHDLVVVVVDVRQHRRAARRAEAHEAAFAQGATLRPIESQRRARGLKGFEPFGGIRHLAVRWIDDERSASLAVHDVQSRPGIQPEGVVAARIARRSRLYARIGGFRIGRREQRERVRAFELGRFRRRQRRLALEHGVALERGERCIGPRSLQVGCSPRRARRLIIGGVQRLPASEQECERQRRNSKTRFCALLHEGPCMTPCGSGKPTARLRRMETSRV